MKLTPQDNAFVQYVNRKLSNATGLPILLNYNAVLDNIQDSADFFYEWALNSTQERWLGIRLSDINNGSDVNGNKILTLSEYVYSISDMYPISGTFGAKIDEVMRVAMSSMHNTSTSGNATINSNSYGFGYGTNIRKVSDGIVGMYEMNMYRQLRARLPQFEFNNLTGQLNIMGQCKTDLMLRAEIRLDVEYLYKDRLFKQYVVAKCFENLSDILGTYSYEIPNGATINFDRLEAKGVAVIDKIEEEIKGMNNNSFIQSNNG